MKKYAFIFFIFIITAFTPHVSCCPYGFSPEDQRPFFEQYDEKIKPAHPEPKEKP